MRITSSNIQLQSQAQQRSSGEQREQIIAGRGAADNWNIDSLEQRSEINRENRIQTQALQSDQLRQITLASSPLARESERAAAASEQLAPSVNRDPVTASSTANQSPPTSQTVPSTEDNQADAENRASDTSKNAIDVSQFIVDRPLSRAGNDFQIQQIQPEDAIDLELVRQVVEQITGKKLQLQGLASQPAISLSVASDSTSSLTATQASASIQTASSDNQPQPAEQAAPLRWGMVIRQQTELTTTASVSFQGSGTVTTADGQEIAFNHSWMQSESSSLVINRETRFGAARLTDPLTLSFNGGPQLSEQRYQFDLDADGLSDQIAFAAGSSYFLALDKNQDGSINNGAELFGAITGNGFQELAAYDEDGNGFIDEGDSVFNQLQLIQSNGETLTLQSLAELGVGALYLGNTSTEFSLNNAAQQQLGQVRSSSLFINEDGSTGLLQHIDLVV